MRIPDDQVKAMYDRQLSVAQTARELGMTTAQVRSGLRRFEGLCPSCGQRPPEAPFLKCASCRAQAHGARVATPGRKVGGSRTRADEQRILDVFKETGNGRETARQTGYSDVTVYQILRKHRGVCARCTELVPHGETHCPKCKKAISEARKVYRQERRHQGLCCMCDQPVAPPSRVYCSEHRLRHLDVSQASHERRKRGTKFEGVPNTRQRERAVRDSYGEIGLAVWRRLEGRCVACGIGQDKVSVQIHHIDGNHSNGIESNLTLLCWHHHRLAHMLRANGSPEFFTWYYETYPPPS